MARHYNCSRHARQIDMAEARDHLGSRSEMLPRVPWARSNASGGADLIDVRGTAGVSWFCFLHCSAALPGPAASPCLAQLDSCAWAGCIALPGPAA